MATAPRAGLPIEVVSARPEWLEIIASAVERLRHAAISNPIDDPLTHAVERQAQGLRPGGLGLMMTRSLVDELIYNEAHNEVIFIKYLD